jgi:DNA-binding beta-propeller fold protein YncE
MSFRRVGGLAAMALGSLLWMSCGQVYRPVVIPVSQVPPNPANFHEVFGISANVADNPGTVLQVDVAGDSDIGQSNMGINPTHAATIPNFSRVFVAAAGTACVENPSLCTSGVFVGAADTITAFTPAADSTIATGIGTPTIYSLPNIGPGQSSAITGISESGSTVSVTLSNAITQAQVGGPIVISGVIITGLNVPNPSAYDGNFTITAISGNTIQYTDSYTNLPTVSVGTATVPLPTFCSYQPDFVATTQTTAVFVANYGVEGLPNCAFSSTDSVAMLNPQTNDIANIAYLNPGNASPAPHPIAMVETPNAQNLYVVNQGNNTVVNLSPTDLSTFATIAVGNTPVWAVARSDNQRVYVLTQGSGTLIPIDVATNTILPSQTNLNVGAGANYMVYDPTLNRLYVTNPTTGNVFVYSATGGVDLSGNANDTPTLLTTISMSGGTTPACPTTCSPVSVAALADGSRFYVASYENLTSCSDPNLGGSPCIVPILSVFDAASLTVKPVTSTLLPSSSPSLSLLVSPPYALTQYAVSPASSCVTPATYAPGTTRFRMFTTASTDSSHVYVSVCDAGLVADVATKSTSVSGTSNNTPDQLMTDIAAPFGACTPGSCGSAAAITSFSITSNVVTFQATNNFIAGEQVQVSGLSIGTYLNGQTLTVLPTGLSGTQFECNFTDANVASTTDTGTAVSIPSTTITSLSINNNVVTFQAVNTFTPGTKVAISGLTSSAGAPIDGQTLIVLATGLSGTQFEASLLSAESNVGPTTDSGTAVPIVPPQSPIFLLTGQ